MKQFLIFLFLNIITLYLKTFSKTELIFINLIKSFFFYFNTFFKC